MGVSCREASSCAPGPWSKVLFLLNVLGAELVGGLLAGELEEPLASGATTLGVLACRFAAGVAKKSAADLLTADEGGGAAEEGGGI